MKTRQFILNRLALLAAAATLISLAAPILARADNVNGTGWNGKAGVVNWSNTGNWDSDAPSNNGNGDRNLFFGNGYVSDGNTGLTTSSNDLSSWAGHRITFESNSSAPAFSIIGISFTLFDWNSVDPRLENDNSQTQTISLTSGQTLGLNGSNGGSKGEINPVGGNITISSGTTVDLGGTTQLQIFGTASKTLSFGGAITSSGNSGNNSMDLEGNSTVIFNGNNTFNGGITFSGTGGKIQVGNSGTSGTLGGGNVTMGASGGTISFKRTDTGLNVANSISGTANFILNQDGAGATTLSGTGDNSFGEAVVNAGTLVLAKTSTSNVHAVGGSTETINNGGTMQLAGTGNQQIAVGSTLTVNSGGTFDLGGQSVTVSSFSFNGVGVNGTGAITNSGSSASWLTNNNPGTLAGNASIGENGAIILTGAGALTADSFEYLTNLGPGTLIITNGAGADNLNVHVVAAGGTVVLAKANTSGGSNPSVHATGQVTIMNGATVQLGGTGGFEVFEGRSSTNLSGGVLDMNGQNQAWGTNAGSVSAGNLYLNGTGISGSGALINSSSTACVISNTFWAGAPFWPAVVLGSSSSIGGSGNLTMDTAISDNGGGFSLTKVGSGTLTLNSNNTYTGSTTISAGTLALGVNGGVSSPTISIAAGATLDVSAQTTFTSGSPIAASGTGTTVGSTAAAINGNGTVSLGSQPINLTFTPTSFTGDTAHPALYISAGTLSLNGNSFSIDNNSGTALGAGTYLIIQQASGNVSSSGTYSVNVTGSGIAGGTTASIQVSGANVNLLVKETPGFSNLTSSQSITSGASSITLGGTLSGAGPVYPASGETITVTINGNAQNTTINDSTGDFSINYNPSTIPASGAPYTITYSYAGDASLNVASDGSTTLTVKSVAAFSNLTPSQSIVAGSSSIALSGKLSAAGPVYPANGETVTVTINGNAQNTTINDSTGDFSINYNPSTIPASVTPYPITYSYPGDGSLSTASDSSTALTVEPSYSAYRIADSSNGSAMAGSGDTLTISAVNSDGTTNSIVSGSITLTFGGLASSPGGTLPTYGGQPATVTLTFSGGQATTTLLAYDATNDAMVTVTDGTHITSSAGGLPLTLTVAAAVDNAYRISTGTLTPTVGNGDTLTINIVDQYQNPSAFTGNKTLNFGGLSAGPDGSLPTVTDKNGTPQPFGSLNTTITFAGGVNTLGGSLVAHKVESSKLLTATDGTLTAAAVGGTAPTLSPVAGAAARLGISTEPSTTATAGAALAQQPVITVLDLYGNPTTGSSASISASAAAGTLFGTSPVNAVNSTTTFTGLSLTNAGTNTLTFSSTGLISTNSTVITNTAGGFVAIGWVTQPAGAVYRTVFGTEPVLAAVDQYGNPTTSRLASSIPVTVALTSGPGALSGTTNYNLGSSGSNGVVSFTDLTIDAVSNDFVLMATATLPASSTPPVTGMAVWLDASDTNSVIGTSPVTQWNDKSGNHYNFGVPEGSGTITYNTTNMNGLPVVSFPGGPALLTANNAYTFNGTSMTLFCVVRSSTYLAASQGPFDSAGATGADGSSTTWGMNAMYYPMDRFTVQGTTVTGSVNLPDGAVGPEIPFIWEGSDNGPANQEWVGYFDGTTSNLVSNTTGAQSAFAITQLAVGSTLGGVNSLSEAWQGDVAEVLLYHSYLSPSQQAQIYSYLQSKWLGGGAGGSSISAATAPFTVSPAPVTITGEITANSKAYDGTTNDTLTIGSVTASGVFAPDNGNVNPNTSGAMGYFADAGPGNRIPVTVTGITLTGTAAGDYVVAPLVLSANITGAAPTYNAFVITNPGPGNLTAGVPSQLIVETVDNTGAVVTGVNGSIAVTFSGLSAGPDGSLPTVTDKNGNPVALGTQLTLNFINGVASSAGEAVLVAHKAETASPHVTDGADSDTSTGGSTISLTVVAGSAAGLGISVEPSATATAGTAFAQQPVIDVLDAYGNVATGSSASVNVSAAVGNVFGAFPTNAVSGVAAFSGLSLTNIGANTLTFSSGSFLTNSTVITVSPATLTMTLASSENPSGYGDSVSFTGTVSPSVAGSIVFATNGVTFDTEALSGGSATSVTTTALPRGTNTVTAMYTGNPDYTGQTNLAQVVTNHPPVLNPANYTRIQNLELAIKLSDLLTNASDADNDNLILGYISPSTNGTSLFDDGTYLYYTNSTPPNVNDAFNYYVNDGFGGLTTNLVLLTVDNSQTGQPILTNYVSGGQSKVSFTGMPNYIYYLQRSTNVSTGTWAYISTNIQSTNGLIQIIDTFQDLNITTPPLPTPVFYRVLVP